MVDELEFSCMDYERAPPVVIRFEEGAWRICHANSSYYQHAFKSKVNKFKTRAEAVEFAEFNDCCVVFHDSDPLQHESK